MTTTNNSKVIATIETSIDAFVKAQNSFYEGFIRDYLPGVAQQIIKDLSAAGYHIVPLPPKKVTEEDTWDE